MGKLCLPTPNTYSGSQDTEVAGSLFTHSFSAIPSIPDTYYTSFERSFRGDSNAVEIVGIGSGVAEIFDPQVGSIELVGSSQGNRSECRGKPPNAIGNDI